MSAADRAADEVLAAALGLLASAPSKDRVRSVVDACFRGRDETLDIRTTAIEFAIGVSTEQALTIHYALAGVIRKALYISSTVSGPDDIASCFPEGTEPRLQKLLAQAIVARLPTWREVAIKRRVSLPRLVDVDWRVDLKTASDHASSIAVPTAVVAVKVEEQPTQSGHVPGVRAVTFELSREALQTMLDGLGRIREELSSIQ